MMRSIRFFMLLASCIVLDARFSLYYSHDLQTSSITFDCLYAHLNDDTKDIKEPFIRNYHLIPYCRRLDTHDEQEKNGLLNDKMGKAISFADLKKQGVTSAHLLTWAAPIDVVELYEKNGGNSQDVFYNCTSPWFGSMCQYMFDYDTPSSFGDIVNVIFTNRDTQYNAMENSTCYPFLTSCYRGPAPTCLDWREICNGKFDCMNGEDEQMCEQLELNECTNDEYRCHYGGQCIPLIFVHDGSRSVDCLDGSDEIDARKENDISWLPESYSSDCNTIPTFLCEESTCRNAHSFSCANGQCIPFKLNIFAAKSCTNCRNKKIIRNLITSSDHISDIDCQQALHCLIRISGGLTEPCLLSKYDYLDSSVCESLTLHCSSDWIAVPVQPILFGFFQFIYLTNRSVVEFENNVLPDFVCFNPQRCPGLLQIIVHIELNNGLTCCHISDIVTLSGISSSFDIILNNLLFDAIQRCLTIGVELECSHPSLFHCSKSLKCISHYRLVDGYKDCYFNEDETYSACQLNDSNRYQCESNSAICLSLVAVGDHYPNCPKGEEDLTPNQQSVVKQKPFSKLCHGIGLTQLGTMNEADCTWWPCNNAYTRCDGLWHCPNGIDELNCPDNKCLENEHACMRYASDDHVCLSIEHLYETYIDDCNSNNTDLARKLYFDNRTNSDMSEYISWNKTKCIIEDKICRRHSLLSHFDNDTCLVKTDRTYIDRSITILMNNGTSMCYNIDSKFSSNIKYYIPFLLSTSRFGFFPSISTTYFNETILMANQTITSSPKINISLSWYCNRGILVLFGYNRTKKCLCPPSYFGDQCQWQNQRISLTLRLTFRNVTSGNAVFQVVVMLINDESGQITPSYEQIIFVPTRDCNTKFNIYLLYPDRPKSLSTNYSIRIDIFDKTTLNYYASWYLSIPFSFLPINRLATRLFIPETVDTELCSMLCGQHGKCRRYINKKSAHFCQCDRGYSGSLCDISHTCNCSNDSICLSSSICICPLKKFGLQCYLEHSICQSPNNPCKNNGLCIPADGRIALSKFTCLCPESYFGEICEIPQTRINIQFDKNLITTKSSVFVHFITAFKDKNYERISTFKKIAFDQNTITLYVQQPFNILFIELSNRTYYLTVVRETFMRSESINAHVLSNQLCPSVHKLVNTTLQNYSQFQRIGYYPLLCRQYTQLMCFYDEIYMCLCDLDRFSNCFEFNHSMSYDCKGQNDCHNGGQCFENNVTCPTVTMCVCQDCYYGTRCQFSTKGLILSLDPILGYHIKPNVPISRQPSMVKASIAIVTLMMAFELVNGLLSIMTFRMEKTRAVGCGWYLLASSVASLCTMLALLIKFCYLVLSQKMDITNRSFLTFNCIVTDASLKTLLAISEWFNACVAMERIFTVTKGVSFNKTKSKKIAKWMIFVIPILTLLTNIHDSFHRQLIDDVDVDEKRTWCFIEYSFSFDIYNSIINFFHFLVPLAINLISAIIIIISSARFRSNAQLTIPFKQHLREQLKQHKQLLLAPCVHVILGVPRLIIPFVKGCMRVPSDSWLFLIGYFIPFVSVMLTFFTHVLPSKRYMKEFGIAFRQTLNRLGLMPQS